MATILHIVASPRSESYSSRLAGAFFEAYREARPNDRIETLDVFQADIPQFYAPQAKAKYAVTAGLAPRDDAEAAWQPVVEAVNHFKRFDMYVVSSSMWNFGVPYRLKQYIDVIVQPSLTFAASAQGVTGLVTGRPLMLLLARGGFTGQATRRRPSTFRKPTCGASSGSSALRIFAPSRSKARCKTSPSSWRPTCARQWRRPGTRPRSLPAK